MTFLETKRVLHPSVAKMLMYLIPEELCCDDVALRFGACRRTSPDNPVVNEKNCRRNETNGSCAPPETSWLMLDFGELMHKGSAEQPADNRPNADGKECKSHVGTLLLGRGEA